MLLPMQSSVFSLTYAVMEYDSAWKVVCNQRLKLCPLFEPHLYTPTPVSLLVLDLSVYQTRPPLLSV